MTQPWGSGALPRWMSTRAERRRFVTGPATLSETENSPSALRTVPTGVITAAVPQAKTSRRRPLAASAFQSSME